MSRSINMAIVMGNLTRDPEMRFTPQGSPVTSFVVATNRSWTNDAGEKQEASEFHNIVSWNKLAELCNTLLMKGTRVYVQGRLQTRSWDDQQGLKHYKTEIVCDDMVVLERGRKMGGDYQAPEEAQVTAPVAEAEAKKDDKRVKKVSKVDEEVKEKEERVAKDEIPF